MYLLLEGAILCARISLPSFELSSSHNQRYPAPVPVPSLCSQSAFPRPSRLLIRSLAVCPDRLGLWCTREGAHVLSRPAFAAVWLLQTGRHQYKIKSAWDCHIP